MRSFLIFCAFTAICAAYFQLPKDWGPKKKKMACEDYCGGESKSTRMGFDFVMANWELCSCSIFPKEQLSYREAIAIHSSWSSTVCFRQCVRRCRRTRGRCAVNSPHNDRYKGQCCTTANQNWSMMAQCFVNGTGACHLDQKANTGGVPTMLGINFGGQGPINPN